MAEPLGTTGALLFAAALCVTCLGASLEVVLSVAPSLFSYTNYSPLRQITALEVTLGTVFTISVNVIENGGNTIAANIANTFGEANATGRGALIASGLLLFAITLVVNVTARAIIYRRREFRDSAA